MFNCIYSLIVISWFNGTDTCIFFSFNDIFLCLFSTRDLELKRNNITAVRIIILLMLNLVNLRVFARFVINNLRKGNQDKQTLGLLTNHKCAEKLKQAVLALNGNYLLAIVSDINIVTVANKLNSTIFESCRNVDFKKVWPVHIIPLQKLQVTIYFPKWNSSGRRSLPQETWPI